MFQEMSNGSIAVITQPSVGTFEKHERNNLTWALIYAVIAGVINAIVNTVTSPLRLGQLRSQLEAVGLSGAELEAALAAQSGGGLVGPLVWALFGTIIASLIGWGIVYGISRAFGGTGTFGELAWGLSLFSSPLSIVSTILAPIPIAGGIATFALSLYGLYLTYLAIQSGMNLPSNKALYVILVLFLIMLVLFGAAALAIIGLGAAGGFAP